jgi:hypothetical protein
MRSLPGHESKPLAMKSSGPAGSGCSRPFLKMKRTPLAGEAGHLLRADVATRAGRALDHRHVDATGSGALLQQGMRDRQAGNAAADDDDALTSGSRVRGDSHAVTS